MPLLLRHGETTWNREGRLQGSLDAPLTQRGRVQAARQGAILRRLRASGPVLCSPQGRARATAALAGLPTPRIEPRLRELGLGAWEGWTLEEVGGGSGVTWKFGAPGGEGAGPFKARLRSLLADLPPAAILVTHGVVTIGLRALVEGVPFARWDRLDDPQGVILSLGSNGARVVG